MRCLKRYVAREVYRVLIPAASTDRAVYESRLVAVTDVT